MLHFLLFFIIFNVYSATKEQADAMEHAHTTASASSLAKTFGVLVYKGKNCGCEYIQKDLKGRAALHEAYYINDQHLRPVAYHADALFYDKCSGTYQRCRTVHISEATEQLFCQEMMQVLSTNLDDDICICTTLDSSATLVLPAQKHALHINVVTANADNSHNFCQILEKNSGKSAFVFVESVSRSLLPAAEFVFQVQQSQTKKVQISIYISAQQEYGNFSVGEIYYGAGPGRIAQKKQPDFYKLLAERTTQAERLNSKFPCDNAFLGSPEYKERQAFWEKFIKEHVSLFFMRLFTENIFSSQTPGNLFVRNNPPKNLTSLLLNQLTGSSVDVLIGTPEGGFLYQETSVVWGCGVRVFNQLLKEGFDARCIFFSDKHLHYTTPPFKNRSLICAGPKSLESLIKKWAIAFSASAYSQVVFVACDTFPPASEYHHILGGSRLDYGASRAISHSTLTAMMATQEKTRTDIFQT